MKTLLKNRKKHFLFFATGNINKIEEVKMILKEYPVKIKHIEKKKPEIQANDVEEIALRSAKWIGQEVELPVFVEDDGLFIEALKGFPGPYASYIFETIGLRGILKLLDERMNRKAIFKSVIAFCAPKKNPICFVGSVSGQISMEERGAYGFGFDPIFEPDNGSGITFGEMTISEKIHYSHRGKSVKKFVNWYLESTKE